MDSVGMRCEGPLAVWIGPLVSWLEQTGCAPGRAQRTVRAFARLSSWMASGGWGVADLDEALIADHVRAERERSGSRFPAAFQYLPLAARFLAAQGVLVLSDRKSRDRGGVPLRMPARCPRFSVTCWCGCGPRGTPAARQCP